MATSALANSLAPRLGPPTPAGGGPRCPRGRAGGVEVCVGASVRYPTSGALHATIRGMAYLKLTHEAEQAVPQAFRALGVTEDALFIESTNAQVLDSGALKVEMMGEQFTFSPSAWLLLAGEDQQEPFRIH